MNLKVKNNMSTQYLIEIFGNQEFKDNLLWKSIPQKTKYFLRVLGDKLSEQEKEFSKKMLSLRETFFEDGVVKEESKEEFETLGMEIMNEEKEYELFDFEESDFVDSKTNKVVGGENIYYNLIDKLIYEK
jgi:hypothetical protein